MDKTTLYLNAVEYRKLKRIASAAGRSPAALVREAVAEYVARHAVRQRPRSIGPFGSRRTDLGGRAEHLLRGFGEPRRTDAAGRAAVHHPRRRTRRS